MGKAMGGRGSRKGRLKQGQARGGAPPVWSCETTSL